MNEPQQITKRHQSINSFSAILQVVFCAVGYGAIQIAAFIASIFFAFFGTYKDAEGNIVYKLGEVPTNFIVNCIAYFVAFSVLLILVIVFRKKGDILSSFKKWQAYVWGVGAFVVIIIFETCYNSIVNLIYQANGIVPPGVNANESAVREMLKYSPVMWFIVFGILGPLVEEMIYRVGLYGLTSRINKWVGALIAALIFALIHFDFTAIGSDKIVTELVNLPDYFFCGFALCFVYMKYGFAASATAHVLNNVTAGILNLIQ